MWKFYVLQTKIMQKFKKIWLFLLGIILPICINFLYNPCLWELSDWNPIIPNMKTESTTTIDEQETIEISQWSHRISRKIKWILRLPEPENYTTWLWYVTTLIQIAINRLLSLLGFIALVYMIYCGFLILSSWNNDTNASKGKKGISTAALALAWIGLSRLIVSAIIRLIKALSNSWMNTQ